MREIYAELKKELDALEAEWKALLETDVTAFNTKARELAPDFVRTPASRSPATGCERSPILSGVANGGSKGGAAQHPPSREDRPALDEPGELPQGHRLRHEGVDAEAASLRLRVGRAVAGHHDDGRAGVVRPRGTDDGEPSFPVGPEKRRSVITAA